MLLIILPSKDITGDLIDNSSAMPVTAE